MLMAVVGEYGGNNGKVSGVGNGKANGDPNVAALFIAPTVDRSNANGDALAL